MLLRLKEIILSGRAIDKHMLSAEGDVCLRTARNALKEMHRRGEIGILCWRLNKTQSFPVYQKGHSPDTERPAPLPGAIRQRDLRKRKKAGLVKPRKTEIIETPEIFLLGSLWESGLRTNRTEGITP